MKRIAAIFVCLLFLASALGTSAVVLAGKPDKCEPWPECKDGGEEPPPEGTIFFKYNDGEGVAIWTMNADGSGKAKQVIETCTDFEGEGFPEEEFGIPSRVKHGDHHWYLRFCGIYDSEGNATTYPDGMGRREIFAVKDDNSVTVQLTSDATLASRQLTAPLPVWGIGDNSISWGAKRWIEGEQYPTDFGIYTADLEWDDSGDLVGLGGAISRIWDTGYWYNENKDHYLVDMKTSHDWAPDETKIVYTSFTGEMYVGDVASGAKSHLRSGWQPQWSPDGSKIAFEAVFNIWTINPDGTGEQLIVERKTGGGSAEYNEDARWSPDGNYLVYSYEFWHKRGPGESTYSVKRVDANGEHKTNLTNDLDNKLWKGAVAWR